MFKKILSVDYSAGSNADVENTSENIGNAGESSSQNVQIPVPIISLEESPKAKKALSESEKANKLRGKNLGKAKAEKEKH